MSRASKIEDHVRLGLTKPQKTLPPILFYDTDGADLFEEICKLDEYYLTRTEATILQTYAGRLPALCAPAVTVVELGSGTSEKTTLVLDALRSADRLQRYVAVDISSSALEAGRQRLEARYPHLELRAFIGDYLRGLQWMGELVVGQGLLLFLGSNLGNYTPVEAIPLLASMRAASRSGDLLLLGVDLVKDPARLKAAYNDAKGVTAEFNLNVLRRINRELGGHFDVSRFEHDAIWNAEEQRIEMHLVSRVDQQVRIDALDMTVPFAAGETIHTENSYKYTNERLQRIAVDAGWRIREQWVDDERLFSVNLLECEPGES